VEKFEHSKGYLKNIVFRDDSKSFFEAIYAPVPFEQHCAIPKSLE
jgi:hypothetical protein